MGDKDLKKWVEKILNWIKSKKLTGVSTPLIGLTWEDKNIVKKIKKRKFVASSKLRVFISSICGDNGKYDKIREILKREIESTGLANVYLFNNGPRTTSAINDYVWNVEDSDLCIFIIDNQDGVTAGVQNEIDAANRNNIKSIYYFCNQYSETKTQLQKNLTGPGKPKYNEISSFDELLKKGTQNLIDEIVATYHDYCKGRLREYNGEVEMSLAGVDLADSEKVNERFLPRVSLKNIDKSCAYILSKTIDLDDERNPFDKSVRTSELDNFELDFLKVIMGELPADNFSVDSFLEELKKFQDPDYLEIVKLRWNAILAFYKGDIDSCIDHLEKTYQEVESKKVPAWVLQDILIDIRNIRILKGNIVNSYSFEAQDKLEKFDEQFHYPVLDRINVTIEEKYIKGLYKKKMDSPNTVYLGNDYSEYGELFASAVLIAMYNGSLTHLRAFTDKLKNFMFYLAEKYNDWTIRKNLLKYAIVSADEKEIGQIVNAYPEILNCMSAKDAEEIMLFSENQPVIFEKMKAKITAFSVVGYYLPDELFSRYEREIVDTIWDELGREPVSHMLGRIVFKNLKKIATRMNSDSLIKICLHVIKKDYVAWYREMFELIKQVDLTNITEEMRKRLILALEELLYEKERTDLLRSGILTYVRNCDRKNTERLEEIVKEKHQEYYKDTYLIDTCNGDSQVLTSYIDELMRSIDRRNKIQGKNGMFSGYARRDYATLRTIFKEDVIPEDSVLKELLLLSKQTICESKESVETKIDAVEFVIMLFGKRPEYCNFFESYIEEMYEKRKQFVIKTRLKFSNIEPAALEFGIILLRSMVSKEDEYYEMMEIIAGSNADTATLMSIVAILRRFFEQKRFRLSSKIDIALLSNVLQWLTHDNLDIRWNSCQILFDLSQRLVEPKVVADKLNDLMDHDCVYIKILIVKNLANISISEDAKKELFRKADSDASYLVRMKSKEYRF